MDYSEIKKRVYQATINLFNVGLIRLSAGNVSARIDENLIAITPRSRSYDVLKPEDICIVSLDQKLVDGDFQPSSETPLHTGIYRELPNVGAVVHTHSIFSITFACSHTPLPILCVESLAAGCKESIPVAQYVSPGSPNAGEYAMEVFREHPGLKAMLLRNHGLLTVGPNVETAWQTAYKVETSAQIAYQALQLGKVIDLSSEQIDEIFRVYAK